MGGNTVPSLKLTNSHFAPENRPFPPRGNTSSSPFYFSGAFAVGFREGAWYFGEVVGVYWKNITMGSPTWNLQFLGVIYDSWPIVLGLKTFIFHGFGGPTVYECILYMILLRCYTFYLMLFDVKLFLFSLFLKNDSYGQEMVWWDVVGIIWYYWC